MDIVKTGWELNPELRELADLGEGKMVADILRGFLNDAEDQISKAEEAIRTRDGNGLKFAAHSLTGSAATVGLTDFSAAVRQLHVLVNAHRFPESYEQLNPPESAAGGEGSISPGHPRTPALSHAVPPLHRISLCLPRGFD